jgi:hypothetical protein
MRTLFAIAPYEHIPRLLSPADARMRFTGILFARCPPVFSRQVIHSNGLRRLEQFGAS